MRFSDLKKITSINHQEENKKSKAEETKEEIIKKKEDNLTNFSSPPIKEEDTISEEKLKTDIDNLLIKKDLTSYTQKNRISFNEIDYEKTYLFYSSLIKRFENFLSKISDLSYISALDDLKYLSNSIFNEIENQYLPLMIVYLTPKNYVISHSINVSILSGLIAKNLNYSEEEIKNLIISALCIDIAMPSYRSLYLEERVLSQSEKKIIQMHVQEGAEIVEKIFSFEPSLKDFVTEIVINSHERYDGTGYYNKNYDELNDLSQIVALSDFYEALTHPRSWREAFEESAVVDMITTTYRKKFSPLSIKGLISSIGVYPPGSFVKLSSGEIAQVLFVNKEKIFRPFIKIIMDSSFNNISPQYLDLSEYPLTSIDSYIRNKDILKNNPIFKKNTDLERLWIEW